MVHELKTHSGPFQATRANLKLFEYRNDRDFKVGDTLLLKEYNALTELYTGELERVEVTYKIQHPDYGIPLGYCVMGTKRINHLDPLLVATLKSVTHVTMDEVCKLAEVWKTSPDAIVAWMILEDWLMMTDDKGTKFRNSKPVKS